MTAWVFPDVPFNINDKDGMWAQCRLVAEDEDTVTVDSIASNTGAVIRVQLLKQDIRAITYAPPAADAAEAFMNGRRA